MDEKKLHTCDLSFATLTEIMERFQTVPYEQFQQELQGWFTSNLKARGRDASDLAQHGFPNLPELISRIYHQAEVQQILSDNQINTDEKDR